MDIKYKIGLTENEIRLVRQLISEKALMVKFYPLPEDGDLFKRICELDKVFYSISQCF